MDKIELSNFKVFNNRFTLDTTGKNMLVYGENGAGKSSIYEAIEMFFFHDILEHRNVKIGSPDKRREVERF
ncbi:MAG: AAA family ATPase, partial [Prevotellaceae bacterium]|nr:AAA family ATPase [Prevotellaceae bacterium]